MPVVIVVLFDEVNMLTRRAVVSAETLPNDSPELLRL